MYFEKYISLKLKDKSIINELIIFIFKVLLLLYIYILFFEFVSIEVKQRI